MNSNIQKQEKISLIVPCYNEQEGLPLFYREVLSVLNGMECDYELIFVNDGSKDGTLSMLPVVFKKFWKRVSHVCGIL